MKICPFDLKPCSFPVGYPCEECWLSPFLGYDPEVPRHCVHDQNPCGFDFVCNNCKIYLYLSMSGGYKP